jgi:hypothetical protein
LKVQDQAPTGPFRPRIDCCEGSKRFRWPRFDGLGPDSMPVSNHRVRRRACARIRCL